MEVQARSTSLLPEILMKNSKMEITAITDGERIIGNALPEHYSINRISGAIQAAFKKKVFKDKD